MIGNITIEVCCGTFSDCLVAAQNNADRIELNAALELGGLTPSRATFLRALTLNIPVAVMIRPRTAGFNYSEEDFQTMLAEATWFANNGASGIVFGFLNDDGTIDEVRTTRMIARIGQAEAIFHKAFDATPDLSEAIELLIKLGIKRILTGGGTGMVGNNLPELAKLQKVYGNRIELLPGGGVRNENVIEILETTGIKQIHLTAKEIKIDKSTLNEDQSNIKDTQYVAVSDDYLKKFMEIVGGWQNEDKR